jgi:uncharacterized membrane protein YhaH (DUF805 family)
MLSDRVQRQIDRLLDEADQAIALRCWEELRATCETLLSLDPDNADAARYLILANDSLAKDVVSDSSPSPSPSLGRTREHDEGGNVFIYDGGGDGGDNIGLPGLWADFRDAFKLIGASKNLIGTSGRINRSDYLCHQTSGGVLIFLGIVFISTAEALLSGPALIGFLFVLPGQVVVFCGMVRRFHDFNWGGGSVLLLLIPFVNTVIAFMLLFRSGTRGANDYGNGQVNPMWPD